MAGDAAVSGLRRLIVDTDTGADDVWAIVEALRAEAVARVEAITVVCGNLPLDLCVKNAMLAEDAAATRYPPVYRGMERPILRDRAFYARNVHGRDGLGEMDLPWPDRPAEKKHAVQAIIDTVMANPRKIEIATCGPLTNLAMALLLEPRLAENVKRVWILGGSAGGRGNMTPVAEYNVYTDPEAASIVLNAGMDTVWIPWDTAQGETEITPDELRRMERRGVLRPVRPDHAGVPEGAAGPGLPERDRQYADDSRAVPGGDGGPLPGRLRHRDGAGGAPGPLPRRPRRGRAQLHRVPQDQRQMLQGAVVRAAGCPLRRGGLRREWGRDERTVV